MDHIDEHLATAALDYKYPLTLKAALAIGKKTLNRYYDKTDHSEVFRIAMGMFYFFFMVNSFLSVLSVAPLSQAPIFQERWVGKQVG
jgi:hypothetical protein